MQQLRYATDAFKSLYQNIPFVIGDFNTLSDQKIVIYVKAEYVLRLKCLNQFVDFRIAFCICNIC